MTIKIGTNEMNAKNDMPFSSKTLGCARLKNKAAVTTRRIRKYHFIWFRLAIPKELFLIPDLI